MREPACDARPQASSRMHPTSEFPAKARLAPARVRDGLRMMMLQYTEELKGWCEGADASLGGAVVSSPAPF